MYDIVGDDVVDVADASVGRAGTVVNGVRGAVVADARHDAWDEEELKVGKNGCSDWDMFLLLLFL